MTLPEDSAQSTSRIATALVLFSVLATGMGQSMTFALMAPLGREVGFGELQVGLIIAGSSLIFTCTSPAWGRTCDRWGRKPILLVGQFGYAVGCLAFALVFQFGLKGALAGLPLYLLALTSRVLMAALISAAPSAASAYVADTTSAGERTAGMGRLGAARTLGAILGPALSGLLVALGLIAPLYIASGVALLSALLIAAIVREPVRKAVAPNSNVRLKLFDRRFFPFILVGFLTFLAFSMTSQTLGFYFQDTFVLDARATAEAIGMGMMASAFMSFFAQTVLTRRRAMTPTVLIGTGLPIMLAGYVFLLLAGSIPLLITAMGVLGLGLGLVSPGFTAGASLAVGADEQGAVGGLVSACPAAGFIFGPVIGTSLYQVSPILPYLGAGLLLIPLCVYAWRIKLRPCQSGRPL